MLKMLAVQVGVMNRRYLHNRYSIRAKTRCQSPQMKFPKTAASDVGPAVKKLLLYVMLCM